MKKLLISALALITVLTMSLAACSDNNTQTPDNGDLTDDWVDDTADDTTDDTNNEDNNGGDSTDTPSTDTQTWVDKNDTVYVLNRANLREGTNTSSTIVATVEMGTALTRTQSNGVWDKIDYNGVTVYILSDLVTISQNRVTFNDRSAENMTLHLKSGYATYLRSSPVFVESNQYLRDNFNLKGTLTSSITDLGGLKLVKLSADGDWAQVTFTGNAQEKDNVFYGTETLYIRTTYIVELAPTQPGDGAAG